METPDLKAILKKSGFKATPGRLALLELLWSESKPLSVEAIQVRLGGEINEVTLYRALEAFAHKRIIRRVDLGHSHAHYEMEKSHHHHLVCTTCGTVEDVEACAVPKVEAQVLKASSRFKNIYSHNLEFFGSCVRCS